MANENIPPIAETETETGTQTEKPTQPATEKPADKQPANERTTTPSAKPTEPIITKPTQAEVTYVLNTDKKNYHMLNCRHVKKIKPENYQESKNVPSSYTPFGTCHPDK